MNSNLQAVTFDSASLIRDETGRKLRVFLHDLLEGVKTYRTVHALTEQVQHQYHGRFAIELIQNGYDALSRDPDIVTSQGRIEMRLVKDEESGTLYVANDGAPFSESNFRSVSRLGQSDKNPENSIGNKGIGFRSVLEISKRPRIWSRQSSRSSTFDGYCFGFDPEFVRSIHAPILALFQGREIPPDSSWFHDLVDLDEGSLARLRSGITRQAEAEGKPSEEWLLTEIGQLSPYLLPWPLDEHERTDVLSEFERMGFSTVLALPLINDSSVRLVEQKLSDLEDESVLFLKDIRSLTLSVDDEARTVFRSNVRAPELPRLMGEIAISCESQTRKFRTWSRALLVDDMPDAVRESIAALPGHWPSIAKAEMTIAVGSQEELGPGHLSIFLPTRLQAGASLYINAPFFGDMSRTSISFSNSSDDLQAGGQYNSYLLSQAADLALEAISEDLQGGSTQDAVDILDILAPASTDAEAVKRWQAHIRSASIARGIDIPASAWMLSDRGWTTLAETSLLPLPPNPRLLQAELIRAHATFPAYVKELDGHEEKIRRLSAWHKIDVGPSLEDQAETIENVAKAILNTVEVDWAGFWEDTCEILNGDLSSLQRRRVLLCTDGELHAGGIENRAIYFRPRQSSDGDEAGDEEALDQIPTALRPFIAILDQSLPVSEVIEGRRQNTKLHKLLLNDGLVHQFRREDVLTDILIPNLPSTPVAHMSEDAQFCRDALDYSLRLANSMEGRGEGQKLFKALAKLPVPCSGGWYPLSSAIFSAGWTKTNGKITTKYLQSANAPTARAVRDRLLRPPESSDWGGHGATAVSILLAAGVHNGVPLIEIGGKDPALSLEVVENRFFIAQRGLEPIDDQAWKEFRARVSKETSQYKKGIYKADKLYWVPGLEQYAEFDTATRHAFFEAILHSAALWPPDWEKTSIVRTTGYSELKTVASPLMLKLRLIEWLSGPSDGWSKPSDRWLVPSRHLSRGRAWTLEHLLPLEPEVTAIVEKTPGLEGVLKAIGIPFYEPDRESDDPRLLDCLARAVQRSSYRNKDVFVGQLRTAWDAFFPRPFSRSVPAEVVVQQPDGQLESIRPTDGNPVYLPGDKNPTTALRELGLPVLVIEPKSARRLSDALSRAYGNGLRSSEQFEMIALTGNASWNDEHAIPLVKFSALDGVIPFLLTIAAYHGSNAQGISSASFNDSVKLLREARVSVVPGLSIVPMVGDTQVAAPRHQSAAWLSGRKVLVLDSGWAANIESVADEFTHLIGRSDLRFQNRKGLSEIWGSDDSNVLEGILRQMDLTLEHYRGVLELWREELGPLVEKLSITLRLLGRADISSRMERTEQRDQLLRLLQGSPELRSHAEEVFQSAVGSRDIFQFGSDLSRLFGASTQLKAWNEELVIRGESKLLNLDADRQFLRHREVALAVLRRIVATFSSRTTEALSFSEAVQRIDDVRCKAEVASNYWEVPFTEFTRAVGEALVAGGYSSDVATLVGAIGTDGRLPEAVLLQHEIVGSDPLEIAATNRHALSGVIERLRLICLAWYATSGVNADTLWIQGMDRDPGKSSLFADRDFFTTHWNEDRLLDFITSSLPIVTPPEVRTVLQKERTLDAVMVGLGVGPDELQGAEKRLATVRAELAQRKRMVPVCGVEFENSDTGLSALFEHISATVDSEALKSMGGVDLGSVSIPKETVRSTSRAERNAGTRTRAPKRLSRSMEDLVGAAGEIHAFRRLQIQYGSDVVTPSNWISAYSARAFPDNAINVDEGRGCDFVFTVNDRTYEIEVKSSEGEAMNFILGTSEIRRARELSTRSRRRPKAEYFILKVDNVLSTVPAFTLLPNPYDPRYIDRFDIVDDGARVTYRI